MDVNANQNLAWTLAVFRHAEMGDEELIESIYGNYPPRDIKGQYSLKRGESIVI